MIARRGMLAAGAAALVSAMLVMPVAPAAAEDYPSWDDVQAAMQSVADREAEADRIQSLIGGLELEAARLGDAAVEAAARSASAQAAHDDAAARASALRAAADSATAKASDDGSRLAAFAAQLARAGGTDVSLRLFFAAGDGSADADLLAALGSAERLTGAYGALADEARAAEANAGSLAEQAGVAETERARLAAEAEQRAAEALAAQEAAQAEVDRQRQTADTLYAQLATLRSTSADLERRYRAGQQAAAEQAAREAAANAAASAGGSGGGSGGDDSAPPPGIVVDPAAARAYAQGRVADYGWGGNEFTCLVLLWNRESSWRADAYNASSGAYGIPQSLPGSKMASAGDDWRTNARTQIEWGLGYIAGRYGSPCGAWAHSERYNWY